MSKIKDQVPTGRPITLIKARGPIYPIDEGLGMLVLTSIFAKWLSAFAEAKANIAMQGASKEDPRGPQNYPCPNCANGLQSPDANLKKQDQV